MENNKETKKEINENKAENNDINQKTINSNIIKKTEEKSKEKEKENKSSGQKKIEKRNKISQLAAIFNTNRGNNKEPLKPKPLFRRTIIESNFFLMH